ncbi:MAG: phosphocholine cytidylyltransferase family protein [Ignavibacteriales bacterium]|nr:phosphocholine cytidylyltransferase family protein [Ignavibacteriales bacterium]
MKCVILAAGESTRLRPLTNDTPKCLLNVGGKAILHRTLENVFATGIKEVAIVVGYKADAIRAFVKEKFPQRSIRFILNPNFASTNNAYSLVLARKFFVDEQEPQPSKEKFLLLDGDIVFSPKLLPFLIEQEGENKIAVRVEGNHDDEEIRVMIDEAGNITMIGKETPLSKTHGESIGIEIFSYITAKKLFEVLENRVDHGKGRAEFYEHAFQEMIDNGAELQAIDTSAFPAVEIDTPKDLELAEQFVATGTKFS